MKKIAFVTTNKMLAQSLATALNNYPELEFESFLLLDPAQAALDAEVLQIDVAVVDMTRSDKNHTQAVLSACAQRSRADAGYRILLLVSQDDAVGKEAAMRAIQASLADDFVFYDASLQYLFAKLAAL